MMLPNIIRTVSDLRYKTKDVMAKAQHEPVVLFEHNSPKGVLLSMDRYEELVHNLEDYYDSIKAQEYEKENKKKVKWAKLDDILDDRK
ncbi:type II toxin-antitoxin system prevent-host-death family antitoxin [Candidatus Roizmanbacteria bacterium]|nr:type II toxin-antitoxin system prevent-host-death family antitoxin [Candidatus Roizmanbacteria bacterium]